MKDNVCSPHRKGVAIDAPPFFFPDCTVCQKKKLDGKVTGLEPPMPEAWHRGKMHRNYRSVR